MDYTLSGPTLTVHYTHATGTVTVSPNSAEPLATIQLGQAQELTDLLAAIIRRGHANPEPTTAPHPFTLA